jgi:glutamate-5-semialdehyde dehydrogenase
MTDEIVDPARAAGSAAPPVGDERYRLFVRAAKSRLDEHWQRITESNERDLAKAREQGLPEALVERMRLTGKQRSALKGACDSIERDLPRGAIDDTPGNGDISVRRMSRPLGVVLMIFEARAEIAVRSALMCASTGNAVLLRGGSEIGETSQAVGRMLAAALADAGLPAGLVTVLDSSSRSQLRELLRRDDAIDVIIPRGSPSLIEHCRTASRIPLIASGGGANHLYVHHSADPRKAAELILDAKLTDPAACTAVEMALVDESALDAFLAALGEAAARPGAEHLSIRVPAELSGRIPAALMSRVDTNPLAAHDNGREFLSPTLAIRPVSGPDTAIVHINRFGSQHTEGVIAEDTAVSDEFCRRVDAATIVINGSLLLNDAPSMGLGVALAIGTGRLHVRGPVTLDALLTHSWIVDGSKTN